MSIDTVKVVLVGESGSGKTSIIQQFAYKIFDPNSATSISSQYVSKVISFQDIGKSLRLEIWDTAGQERYRSMAKLFYQDAKIIIFVYDVTSKKTFDELIQYWIPEVENNNKKNNNNNAIFGVIGNKSDLFEIEQVSREEGSNLADKINAVFQLTSAKLGMGIANIFNILGRLYIQPDYDYKSKEKNDKENFEKKKINEEREKLREKEKDSNVSIKIRRNSHKKKKGCCG